MPILVSNGPPGAGGPTGATPTPPPEGATTAGAVLSLVMDLCPCCCCCCCCFVLGATVRAVEEEVGVTEDLSSLFLEPEEEATFGAGCCWYKWRWPPPPEDEEESLLLSSPLDPLPPTLTMVTEGCCKKFQGKEKVFDGEYVYRVPHLNKLCFRGITCPPPPFMLPVLWLWLSNFVISLDVFRLNSFLSSCT